MRLQRRTRIQFLVFVVIAIAATGTLAFGYGRLGAAWFGFGSYAVSVELPETAGLYERANVTYRGTTVGRVDAVRLTDSGVEALLSVRSEYSIPAGVSAAVHSQSAIGEQYLELVPATGASGRLRNGDVIPLARTTIPPDINEQLDMTAASLQAIPKDNLKTVIDESFIAIGGLGPELGRIIDGAAALTEESRSALDELTNVIDNSGPLLDSQNTTSDDIIGWAAGLATVSGQLRDQNDSVSSLLENAGPVADNGRALIDRLRPSVPVLMANLVTLADISIVYNPHIEQLLVLLPQTTQQVIATTVTNMHNPRYRGGQQTAATNLNLPPPCTTGFLPASQRRSPVFEDYPDRPDGDFYCRIPQDSPWNVRGARNIPCANNPAQRAPLVWMCETGTPYVPLNDGNNWKGDPNATTTGQDVPQVRPGQPETSTPPEVSSDGTPPSSTPPALVGVADYNPADGTYVGPDGQTYTQSNLAADARPPTLQSMLYPLNPGN